MNTTSYFVRTSFSVQCAICFFFGMVLYYTVRSTGVGLSLADERRGFWGWVHLMCRLSFFLPSVRGKALWFTDEKGPCSMDAVAWEWSSIQVYFLPRNNVLPPFHFGLRLSELISTLTLSVRHRYLLSRCLWTLRLFHPFPSVQRGGMTSECHRDYMLPFLVSPATVMYELRNSGRATYI